MLSLERSEGGIAGVVVDGAVVVDEAVDVGWGWGRDSS